MRLYLSELPYTVPCFVLLDEINNVVVGDYLLVLVVHLTLELDEIGVLLEFFLGSSDSLEDLGSNSSTIFFRWHEE